MASWRNPFSFLFAGSRREDYLVHYVIRECAGGRPLAEVLNDRYVRNRSTAEQQARLLDRPEVVSALGAGAIEVLKRSPAAGADRTAEAST
jgi:hypothetical protein